MRLALRWAIRAMLVLLTAFVLLQLWYAAHIWWWRDHPPSETAFMSVRLAELKRVNPGARLQYTWVPYQRISVQLKRAMIAAEDAKFVEHEGFDWEGIQHAMDKNLKKGRVVAGGSTISQQLAKNLFLSGERNFLRKAQELVLSWELEAILGKRRILELYLNEVEWGEGVFGATAAAQRYFGVGAAAVGAQQAAQLAVMLPAPKRFEKRPGSAYVVGRAGTIVARMGRVDVP